MKQKNYEATIGFIDRYTGTSYVTITFPASNKKVAKKIALERADSLAYQYCPDSFFVEEVREIA